MNLHRTSVLSLGARGKQGRRGFVLAGRTCIRSTAGGLWNEWRMAFDDGAEATLAEAMSGFAVYVPGGLEGVSLGKVARSGDEADSKNNDFVVVERGEAERIKSWGKPFGAVAKYRYVDLSSRTGFPATIDRTETASYVGTRVELAALGLVPRSQRARFFPAPPSTVPPLRIAIGAEGTLACTPWRVIGALGRSVEDDGKRFRWTEYILHDARRGFRWLVDAAGEWLLAERVEPGLVVDLEESAKVGGVTYRWTSGGTARLDWAAGELPWDASLGERCTVHDFVKGPAVLSFEGTKNEIAWSRGHALTPSAVARAFGSPLTASRR